MQTDFHFYATRACCHAVGLPDRVADLVAWACQFTDDNTAPELYGLATQAGSWNWAEHQVQATAIVPFHFVPGDAGKWPWAVTPANWRVKALVNAAVLPRSGDSAAAVLRQLQIGIALHALQDSFSHQGFSGWREDGNACFEKGSLPAMIPNVGHAEMMNTPDDLDLTWTDPRSGEKIVNRRRAWSAVEATLAALAKLDGAIGVMSERVAEIEAALKIEGRQAREKALTLAAGRKPGARYEAISRRLRPKHLPEFHRAARAHLARFLDLTADFPSMP